MSKRITLSTEERVELVLRLLRKEATARELAREASISEPTLYQWRDRVVRSAHTALEERAAPDAEKRRYARELAKRD